MLSLATGVCLLVSYQLKGTSDAIHFLQMYSHEPGGGDPDKDRKGRS